MRSCSRFSRLCWSRRARCRFSRSSSRARVASRAFFHAATAAKADAGEQLRPDVETLFRTPAVHAALAAGINFFDTAQAYQVDGDRCSERMLGVALKGRRKEAVIASKFGLHAGEDQTVFDGAMITAAIDETLEALQTEYLDLMQVQ